MPTLTDVTTVTLDLKWLVLLASLLLSAGGMLFQMRALTEQVAKLEAAQQQSERAIIETIVTLKAKKVIE